MFRKVMDVCIVQQMKHSADLFGDLEPCPAWRGWVWGTPGLAKMKQLAFVKTSASLGLSWD